MWALWKLRNWTNMLQFTTSCLASHSQFIWPHSVTHRLMFRIYMRSFSKYMQTTLYTWTLFLLNLTLFYLCVYSFRKCCGRRRRKLLLNSNSYIFNLSELFSLGFSIVLSIILKFNSSFCYLIELLELNLWKFCHFIASALCSRKKVLFFRQKIKIKSRKY